MLGKFLLYFKKNKIEVILIISILLIASVFRLYRIGDYMTFLGDEGRDAIVAKDILHGDFTLLGPRASAGDFFLGPIYYYMMAPFLLFANYDPVGPAIMVAIIGIATVYLIYHVGKVMFGLKAASIAASLYAIAPVVVAYSRSSWNPNPMPFFSLLCLYALYIAVKSKKLFLFFIVGLLLGIAMQLHYLSTFLAAIIFFIVLLSKFVIDNKISLYKVIVQYVVIFFGFLIGFAPFLLFEVRHGFPNIQTIFKFIIGGSGADSASPTYSFLGNIWDVFYRLFARLITKYPPPEQVNVGENFHLQVWMTSTLLLAILAVYYLLKIKDRLKIVLFGAWFFIGIILFGFYKKNIYDYYLGFMFPLPFLLVGNFFSHLMEQKKKKKMWVFLAGAGLLFLFVINLLGSPFLFTPNKQKDQAKSIADFVLSKTDGKPFNFALLTRGNSDHVYRYFFETANRAPVTIENPIVDPERKSVTDQLLIVCEYAECQPLGNPLWEVAGFGRAEIKGEWNISFVKVFRLVHYTRSSDFSLEKLELNTRYENSDLGMSFSYPQEFSIKDESNDQKKYDSNIYLQLRFTTPEIDPTIKNSEKFDWKKYSDNTIWMVMTVKNNNDNIPLISYLEKDFQGFGIDGKTSVMESLRQNLRLTDSPKTDSYVYEGVGGGEHPKKTYYFANQNYIYYFTMSAATDTGAQYTQAAEKLFDEIIKTISFK